jgi:hypothetical protein
LRAAAAQRLRRRDPHQITALLVALIRDPQLDPDPILFHYWLKPIAWDAFDAPGFLYVRGPQYDVLRRYTLDETLVDFRRATAQAPGRDFAERLSVQRERQMEDLAAFINQIRWESSIDVANAREHVRRVNETNARVIRILTATIGQDLGRDPEAWKKWWAEERGYAYETPPQRPRHDLTLDDQKPTYYDNDHYSCFAAGTPVQTLAGPRPIESIAIGDQVLTQDLCTGALHYQPVVDAPHNKPDRVFKIELGPEAIKATGIHRFWKAGHGWVMARDLKPGDVVRALGGVARVESIEPAGVEPVYNLKVLQAESFFAGTSGILVHDNSEVQPVAKPFDATPELSAAN